MFTSWALKFETQDPEVVLKRLERALFNQCNKFCYNTAPDVEMNTFTVIYCVFYLRDKKHKSTIERWLPKLKDWENMFFFRPTMEETSEAEHAWDNAKNKWKKVDGKWIQLEADPPLCMNCIEREIQDKHTNEFLSKINAK